MDTTLKSGTDSGTGRNQEATIRTLSDMDWVDLGLHEGGALTKLLITRGNSASNNLDFYVSCYLPAAYADNHSHEETEEVFYFMSGEGTFVLDGVRHAVRPGTVIHVPPGVMHSIINTGMENLVFSVSATPPEPRWNE